ncbi:MAG TPA: hypothetical protein DHV88_00640 [Roseburia sp.]|nr:hypothetical protein [Roseburia sp.]
MCQRGASEHGCEFAPVARKKIKFKSKFLVPLTVFMPHSHPANAVDIQALLSKDYRQSLFPLALRIILSRIIADFRKECHFY